jgi:hypothetical protein
MRSSGGPYLSAGVLVGGAFAFALSLYGQITSQRPTFMYDRDVQTSFIWSEQPRWDGQILVGYDKNHSPGPIIYSIDREGRREETLLDIPGAAHINLFDIAASREGEIAVVGDAITADTLGATFLVRISADRKQQTITRVWPYCPAVITFVPDGTLWTIGHTKDYENTRDLDLYVLRRFDRTGRMLSSSTQHVRGWATAQTSVLRSSLDRVGWMNLGGQYIEYSFDGSEIGRYEGPVGFLTAFASRQTGPQRPDLGDIKGMAIDDADSVVVGVFKNRRAEIEVLDRETRTWIPAALPTEYAPKWVRVLGFDGSTLVTYSQNGILRRFSPQSSNTSDEKAR